MATVGSQLKAHRLSHNITQAEMAAKLGCTQAMVADIEAGTKSPGPKLSAAISSAMGADYYGKAPRGPYSGRK
jgi:transcriptional regulator with XRE-family HTH domain